jgi:3-hydroxyacyl-CoA dehydrogenase/3-hydroxy-2-methylbutyryl-CoA dehydrogenase
VGIVSLSAKLCTIAYLTFRASGLGRACVEDICRGGGYVAIFDMNEKLANEVTTDWGGKTKFFETNVLHTESVASAVKGALEWVKQTGMEVGGVIAAAGVSTPAKVDFLFH